MKVPSRPSAFDYRLYSWVRDLAATWERRRLAGIERVKAPRFQGDANW